MFDYWQMGLDAQRVMTTRILLMMSGELTSREAHLMFTEKHEAYSRAQVAGTIALFAGRPADAIGEMVDVYRNSVSANCSRLSEQR
jgi:hypothetical protein